MLVRRNSKLGLCSCMIPSKGRCIGTPSQNCMCSGRPSYQKLFTGYIRGVRLTISWGSWITPASENHLQAYFDLRVIVWSTVEGLGQTREVARLPGQLPLCQSQAILCTVVLPCVMSGLKRSESCQDFRGPQMVGCGSCPCRRAA